MADVNYGIVRTLEGMTFATAVERVREALAAAGFGVLTEIDVKATLKKKLDVDGPDYLILGACNPPLAHQALEAEPMIGLLLPCNVVVAAQPDGSVCVAAIKPEAMFRVVENAQLATVVDQVDAKLQSALAAI
jgi:uncharacterized protein (DUF302 family)